MPVFLFLVDIGGGKEGFFDCYSCGLVNNVARFNLVLRANHLQLIALFDKILLEVVYCEIC